MGDAAGFSEVKAAGSTRTPDQTAAALYWGQTNATATMASIIRSVANGQGGRLADHARLLARTYAAIREAAADGNDATEADPRSAAPRPAALHELLAAGSRGGFEKKRNNQPRGC